MMAESNEKQRPVRGRRRLVLDENVEVKEPSLEWKSRTLQWGTRAKPGKGGLKIGDLNVGIYGEIPDHWEEQTRMPRGAYPMPGVPPIGIALRSKRDLWADNAADLYEEAIQRRWVPATDIPWDTIEPLPDDVEAAMCQLCTELSQAANVEFETIGYWLQHMSFGYHEVKLFLATNMFDAGRHHEAFRKRALSNGGGLGLESRGEVNRMILESKGGWSETSLLLHLLRGTFIMSVYRYGERYANNPCRESPVWTSHAGQGTPSCLRTSAPPLRRHPQGRQGAGVRAAAEHWRARVRPRAKGAGAPRTDGHSIRRRYRGGDGQEWSA